jgi:hypothetical protein
MAAKRRAPKKSTKAPAKPRKKAPAKKSPPKKSAGTSLARSPRDRRKLPTAYDRRNANAREKGYKSYWDERQSRTRAREAINDVKAPSAPTPTLSEVDQLGVLGRGDSQRDLFYKAKAEMEKYQTGFSDREIWSFIRIFYKPRSKR